MEQCELLQEQNRQSQDIISESTRASHVTHDDADVSVCILHAQRLAEVGKRLDEFDTRILSLASSLGQK
eukprot:7565535-Karenia_brevis.AAC.1